MKHAYSSITPLEKLKKSSIISLAELKESYLMLKKSYDDLVRRVHRLRKICWLTMIAASFAVFIMQPYLVAVFADYFVFWFALFSDMWAWRNLKRNEIRFVDMVKKMKEAGLDI